ncbi:MAG TPA: alpha/beta fold hydrolase [Gemmatimonadales bacterium]|nr:alpha/beta fold hydrolase [Gemmatimonadales bacterium]
MATPTHTRHRLPGALGDILIDVRAGGRGTPRPAVIVVHGFKGFKDWGLWPSLAERLAKAGYSAVTLNLSGSGVDETGEFVFPERFGHNTFTAEVQDLRRVVDALAGGGLGVAPPTSLGLLGHSRGGGVSVLLTADDHRVRALATWAAISTVQRWPAPERSAWRAAGVNQVKNARTGQILPQYTELLDDIEQNAEHLDIEAAARRIAVPWLIVHGRDDAAVPLLEGEQLAKAARAARFLPIDGAGHTFGATHPWRGSTAELERAIDATLAFFAAELR